MTDRWAAWLLEHRFGGDPAARERIWPQLCEYRDSVIKAAAIKPGDVVLDVGCGDGLLAVEALEHVGGDGRVVFSDISTDLLDQCRSLVDDPRASFVHTGLPGLEAIPDGSADAVMTRSVLIYVQDKRASLAALYRVLRPGGRMSLFEPINRFCRPEPPTQLWGYDITGLEPLAERVKAAFGEYQAIQQTLVDFDERDLLAAAVEAGFTAVHLDYRADLTWRVNPLPWEATLRASPNPLVPPLGEILAEALDEAERARLAEHIESRRDTAKVRSCTAVAYLAASR